MLKPGGRTVPLYTPFEASGRKIEAITFRPITLDDVIRWEERAFATPLAFMATLTDPKLSEMDLRQCPYPSFGIVLDEWLMYLVPSVRESIVATLGGVDGRVATFVGRGAPPEPEPELTWEPPPEREEVPGRTPDGIGLPIGPGANVDLIPE